LFQSGSGFRCGLGLRSVCEEAEEDGDGEGGEENEQKSERKEEQKRRKRDQIRRGLLKGDQDGQDDCSIRESEHLGEGRKRERELAEGREGERRSASFKAVLPSDLLACCCHNKLTETSSRDV